MFLIIWGNSSKIDDILHLQKRSVRAISNAHDWKLCQPLFIKLNIYNSNCRKLLGFSYLFQFNIILFKSCRDRLLFGLLDKLKYLHKLIIARKVCNHLPYLKTICLLATKSVEIFCCQGGIYVFNKRQTKE